MKTIILIFIALTIQLSGQDSPYDSTITGNGLYVLDSTLTLKFWEPPTTVTIGNHNEIFI